MRGLLLAAALLLLVLGTGNILMARAKLPHALSDVSIESSDKLKTRLEYYELVLYGGRCMLGGSLICFVLFFLMLKRGDG